MTSQDHVDRSIAFAFRAYFGVTDQEACTLTLLFRAAPGAIATADLASALRTTRGSLGVCVHALRQALEVESIDWAQGRGYSLTEVGVAECRGALRTMMAELVEATAEAA